MKRIGHMRRAFIGLAHVRAELDAAIGKPAKCKLGRALVHAAEAGEIVKQELEEHALEHPGDNDNGETPAEYLEDAIAALGRFLFCIGQFGASPANLGDPPDLVELHKFKGQLEQLLEIIKAEKGPTL